jgi:hypothetical protein
MRIVVIGGVVLLQGRNGAHRIVFLAAAMMAAVTAAATALRVMGVPAAIIGIAGSLLVVAWVVTQDKKEQLHAGTE